jgi:hypothetical protein
MEMKKCTHRVSKIFKFLRGKDKHYISIKDSVKQKDAEIINTHE